MQLQLCRNEVKEHIELFVCNGYTVKYFDLKKHHHVLLHIAILGIVLTTLTLFPLLKLTLLP